MLKKIKYIVTLFFITGSYLLSQSADMVTNDFYVTPELDTVLLTRSLGDFWFGPMVGGNFNIDVGELNLPRKPWLKFGESDLNDTLYTYLPGYGSGYFFGVLADWQPANEIWGASVRAYIWDTWTSTATSDKYKFNLESEYENITSFTYLTISPSGRYNFHKNFHAFAGLDIALNLSYSAELKRVHVNPETIKHDYLKYEFSQINTRFGGHVGVAYEVIIADINHRLRLMLSPFISIHAGTSMISDYESSWNTVTARLGISMKIGPDNIEYDTIPYVPAPEKPVIILAGLDRRSNITFPGFSIEAFSVKSELAMADRSIIEEEMKFEPAVTMEVVSKPDILKAIAEKADIVLAGSNKPKEKLGEKIKLIEFITNVDKRFNYPSSAATDLTKEMKQYLDQVAVYLKENSGAQLGITGHSDDQGKFEENDQRARNRANAVADYLVKKGIPRSRLLANGKGSIDPVASNKTESGRRQNRRVEIRIVPSAKNTRRGR